ncbi:tRNA (adenosine(37)-N6)-threonylcarbamoyltransferase complex dimerization subunit type 1 TsaB [Syntrophus aciditrophicus]|jgi:tRNA threonylcarbamoyladenosine biosynthesis protein TsaB|uniref:Non-proteolytic protein peptidase M22 family, putative molecular chaperone n=1 Tax=Syntrophus aciditrophicus (strain SB) TaxID=56780 RepID=Q2LTR2_SYNAS|nr:tRNA (adenosine(37)-N6)-threonylcarbamoyltransferase complex dimerization subunit type 1 TsaB [Syntrophus aciditrophicus]ABC77472.1 non-proteolytic protein peptidase M22 family, putative molecular chaperone [Syntrophus aciditrophicus SB]OPY19040.1 MAG: tRNA threonylcarbamoyladenosine biosynthesis protein TsaB [Syntrophus sp. PtaB.Bin075]
MMTLALDTSSKTVGIALLDGEEILAETFFNLNVNSSLLLLPAIEDMFRITNVSAEHIDLWACTVGPGSFTGLRIGVGTVKGLALATGRPVVGVSTLEALAFNGVDAGMMICPMMDAQKNQIYTALYFPGSGYSLKRIGDERSTDLQTFLVSIDENVLFIGDGALKHRDRISEFLPSQSCFAAPHLHAVRASSVGLLGLKYHERGETLDLLTFTPRYLRLSEAELKLAQQNIQAGPESENG